MLWTVIDAFLIPGIRRRHTREHGGDRLETVFA